MPERKPLLIRLDPAVHEALARWAADELRSTNAHIELLLRSALFRAGRLPRDVGDLPRRGRPPKTESVRRAEPSAVSATEADPGRQPDEYENA
jgi:hypothetical protein